MKDINGNILIPTNYQHAAHEVEEEQITNRLLKHIDGLKKEKTEILTQMEQEEEHIANTLQKRLAQVCLFQNGSI